MSTPNLPPFSHRMCEVLYAFFASERPYEIYGNITDDDNEEQDNTFDTDVKALKNYFKQRSTTMQTIEQVVQQQKQRITCETTGKLIATVTEQGLSIWCMYQKRAELITWEQLDALRAKCEGVPGGQSEAC